MIGVHECAIVFRVARRYEMKRRAERQAETRRRIVEAAVELHTTIGPARTTVSAIAGSAGVQRHTVYAHFPDEAALFEACSGHYMARNPPPDPAGWAAVKEPWERLGRALADLYGWYAANEGMLANMMRDQEVHPVTRQSVERRMGPWRGAAWDALTAGLDLGHPGEAALALALQFSTWRSLVRESRLGEERAAEVMRLAVRCAARA